MSTFLPNSSIPLDPDSSNRHKTNINIAASQLISSNGVAVSRGITGTQVELITQYAENAVIYYGQLDMNGSYHADSLVTTSASFDYEGLGSTTPVATWIADSTIPPPGQRIAGIKYAPFLPEPSIPAHLITDGSQGRYWRQLGASGGSLNYSRYNYSSSYAANDFVNVTGSTLQYTDGSTTKWSYPGIYICIKDVAALSGSLPSGSRGGTFQMPYYPDSDYWDLWAFAPNTFEGCGGKIFYVNSAEKEPPTASVVHL
jgi:hypothetical protein